MGRALGVGCIRNGYGDANALVRRELFWQIGGFSEDYGVGHEDWEFFAKAALQGARFAFIPKPLFWYRISNTGMLRSGHTHRDHYRSLRPYIDHLPRGIGAALGYGLYLHLQQDSLWRQSKQGKRTSLRTVGQILPVGIKLAATNSAIRLKFKMEVKKRGWNAAFKKSFRYLMTQSRK